MKNLSILVKMQLKEQLNFQRLELKHINFFHVLVATLGAILKFAFVVALCVLAVGLSKSLNVFSLTKYVPTTVISLAQISKCGLMVASPPLMKKPSSQSPPPLRINL